MSTKDPSLGSYLPASYVKWIEGAGGRALPLPYDATDAQVEDAFSKVNGLLFIGGGAGYSGAAKTLFNLAAAANEKGDYFPVWGTCDGFEWLVEFGADNSSILVGGFDSENISLPINLSQPAASASRLLKEAELTPVHGSPSRLSVLEAMSTLPITMNNHMAGLTPKAYRENPKLQSFFTVLSTNMDRKGKEFVSIIEHPTLPFWGTQFHPEKSLFEWGVDFKSATFYEAISHTREAVAMAQFFANFFVDSCRRSTHSFISPADSWPLLIYGKTLSTAYAPSFIETYVFPNANASYFSAGGSAGQSATCEERRKAACCRFGAGAAACNEAWGCDGACA